MSQHVLREEIDYTIFAAEPEYYLAELHGGCPGGEREALERTIRNYPGQVTEDDVRGWARDPKFRAALKYARQCGEENRRYDLQRVRQGDPFATPPRPGTPLIPVEEYSPDNPPAGGLRGWLRRFAERPRVEVEQTPTPGVRFIAGSEMTDGDWHAVATQSAAVEAARLRREQQAHAYEQQPWNGKGLSPDGAEWGR